jgi:hypothetical protein
MSTVHQFMKSTMQVELVFLFFSAKENEISILIHNPRLIPYKHTMKK